MDGDMLISEAAERLLISPQYLRMLEWEGKIPKARRAYGYRVYSEADIARLKSMGIGSRPRKLKQPGTVLGANP
jgi:hypothetical protein